MLSDAVNRFFKNDWATIFIDSVVPLVKAIHFDDSACKNSATESLLHSQRILRLHLINRKLLDGYWHFRRYKNQISLKLPGGAFGWLQHCRNRSSSGYLMKIGKYFFISETNLRVFIK